MYWCKERKNRRERYTFRNRTTLGIYFFEFYIHMVTFSHLFSLSFWCVCVCSGPCTLLPYVDMKVLRHAIKMNVLRNILLMHATLNTSTRTRTHNSQIHSCSDACFLKKIVFLDTQSSSTAHVDTHTFTHIHISINTQNSFIHRYIDSCALSH